MNQSLKNKLDKLVGDFFRSKPCDYHKDEIECAGRREWCHIISRRYLSIRWNTLNAVTLCSKQHRYFTDNPIAFTNWLDKEFPLRTKFLKEIFKEVCPLKEYQFEELYEKLKEELQ